jgi:hypothetical protein
VELECRVKGHDGIGRELRCHQVGVWLEALRRDARGDDGEDAAADADEAASRDVLRQEVLGGQAALAGVKAVPQIHVPAEDLVGREEVCRWV